jgi:hypothetical protein
MINNASIVGFLAISSGLGLPEVAATVKSGVQQL